MVKRKPVGQANLVPEPLSQAAGNPPYPTSSIEPTVDSHIPPIPSSLSQSMAQREPQLHPESSYEMVGHHDVPRVDDALDEEESDDEWGGDTDEEDEKENAHYDLPAALKPGMPTTTSSTNYPSGTADASLPAALRPGIPQGAPDQSQVSLISAQSTGSNPWQNAEGERRPSATFKSNNPFLRMQHSGQNNPTGMESSSSIWAEGSAQYTEKERGNSQIAVELPADQTPSSAFAKLSILDQQAPFDTQERPSPNSQQAPLLSVEAEEADDTKSRKESQDKQPSAPPPRPPIPAAHDFSREVMPVQAAPEPNIWDNLDHQLATDEATAKELAHMDTADAVIANPWQEGRRPVPEAPPDLPPRPSQDEEAPAAPSRPEIEIPPTITAVSRSATESPSAAAQQQRKEHYQIKHIRWYDASFDQLRESPILIQNLNGPCPLLALVNALVLSTPPALDTGLLETLRTREQVSLGLLLDSVFDELVSGRRGDTAANLPDVSELYQFLLTLHTGMNVNPRFVPKAVEAPNLMDADGPVTEMHPALRQPGGFEETKEMRLYSTFDVPLLHGWLPPKGSEAYNAFSRSATSFEDAQNIQFYEEELEERLRDSGLNPEEIRQFEDITTIKEFLNRWPTQLTDYGLETIKQYANPASISIFFRNDHFSTLYKEPKSGRLMCLVTDAGYSTHDEIVWESLNDVNGRNSEFFSGDFMPVGGPTSTSAESASSTSGSAGLVGPRGSSAQDGWSTVAGKRPSTRPDSPQPPPGPPPGHRDSGILMDRQETGVVHAPSGSGHDMPTSPSQTEQEDHDLALALQLQEEEEDRARRERAARAAENERLNQQFLEADGQVRRSSGQDIRPLIPPRRNGAGAAQSNAQNANAAEDAPPPTYEQAAKRPAYHPPPGHPSSTGMLPAGQQGAGRASAQQPQAGNAFAQGRRRPSRPLVDQIPSGSGTGRGRGATYGGIGPGYSQPVGDERDKCIVM